MELTEIVNQIVQAGLSPDQIGTAAAIVAAIQQAGLDPAAVAAAVAQAEAPPAAPQVPAPDDPAPIFAYLSDGAGSDNPEVPLLAAMVAIDAQDWPGTMAALMDLYRSALACKPEMHPLYAQQKQRIAAEQTAQVATPAPA